jgi:retron-type reverse transcriptase
MGLSAEGAQSVKRYGNLWPQVVAFENLVAAALKAQRGKRYRGNVLEFNSNLEVELERIQEELISGAYTPGDYRTFLIYEPKKRMISAAPYRDRVVHHALCNIIVPIFEKTLIDRTYANRVGYGTHRALHRFTVLARNRKYVLQCDIRQYFPSIDHDILKRIIRRKIKCAPTLRLIDRIIDASNEQMDRETIFPVTIFSLPTKGGRGCRLEI